MALYLVTGGAGFIGSHLVDALLGQGDRVRVLDNFSTGKRRNLAHILNQIELQEGDIRDTRAVQEAMCGVNYVLHQAALPSVPRSVMDPLGSNDVNVVGTLNVLIAARDAGVRGEKRAPGGQVVLGEFRHEPHDSCTCNCCIYIYCLCIYSSTGAPP
jgi:nucleoside-diphosphate-sugar epimerase